MPNYRNTSSVPKKKRMTFFGFGYADMGGVVKVDIYEVDTKIALYVDTFWLGL